MSRAEHDQGPRGYPVSGVEPMTMRSVLVSTIDGLFILFLLAFTVTLSLGRPHCSCKYARPKALTGTEHQYPILEFTKHNLQEVEIIDARMATKP